MKLPRYTIDNLHEKFPDDDACLDFMFAQQYGSLTACSKCGVVNPRYYRVRNRKCYECNDCGYQLSPLANTIFHKSDTPLKKWFFAIYMFSVSRNGVSAKELERTLGVTYKTAWRMAKQIRLLMAQEDEKLVGKVEVDETYIGGKHRRRYGIEKKQIVFGMVERQGRVKASVVKSSGTRVLLPQITENIALGTEIHSDEYRPYSNVTKHGYSHTTVNHSKLEYVRGVAHTNTIEGFWSQLKRSIDGTYHAVSPKYLPSYLNEFVFRYNVRQSAVFLHLLAKACSHVQ